MSESYLPLGRLLLEQSVVWPSFSCSDACILRPTCREMSQALSAFYPNIYDFLVEQARTAG